MRLTRKLLTALVCLGILVSACAQSTPNPSTQAPAAETELPSSSQNVSEIKVGALLPLSGIDATAGEHQKDGHEFAIRKINEAGGIKCLDGAKLRMVYGDSQSRAETGNTETERLITSEKVIAVVGAYHTEVTLPATEISERYEVPFFVANALAGEITNRGLKYVFKTATSLEAVAEAVAEFAVEMGAKNVAIQFPDGTFGIEFADAFREAFPKHNLKIVADVTTTWGATDFTDNILQLKSADPDVVFSVGSTPDEVLLVKQMAELGWWPRMGLIGPGGGWSDPAVIENLGELSENIYLATDWFPNSSLPNAKDINDEFKEAHGYDMLGNVNTTYAATWLLADALEKSCSTDPKKLANVLRTTKFEGSGYSFMYPYVKFDETGYNETSINIVGQIQNGQAVAVWPDEYAVADPIWPGIPSAFSK